MYKLPYNPLYDYVTTEEEARKVLNFLDRFPVIAVDTETDGKESLTARCILIQIGIPEKAYLFDVRKLNPELLKGILQDKSKKKLLQYAKFDFQILYKNFGIKLNNIFDTCIAEQLLNLGLMIKVGLEDLVRRYLGFDIDKDMAKSFVDRYDAPLTREQKEYAANDVLVLHDIAQQQKFEIKENKLERVCKLEFDCVNPIARMELNGIKLDAEHWLKLGETVKEEHTKYSKILSEIFGKTVAQRTLFDVEPVNLASPIQLLGALHKLGFQNLENTSEKSLKQYRTDPIIKQLLHFRELEKSVTSYGDLFLQNISSKSGRIHSEFRQLVSTGRMACASKYGAGLQQIKKDSEFRSCFVAEEGNSITTSDYSNMELRILADYSQEPAWVEAFKNNIDMHATTASLVYNVPIEFIIADDKLANGDPKKKGYRDKAKAINFGLAYGMSEFGLAARLGVDIDTAQGLIGRFFDACPQVKRFLDKSARLGVEKRYAETKSGRKRFFKLPPFDDPEFEKIKRSIERKSKNTPIQGSNADVTKQALIYLQDEIDNRGLEIKIIHCVHDEIVAENNKKYDEEMLDLKTRNLTKAWDDFFEIVPIKIDSVVRNCWSKK